jgi:prevent-host-death family protein
MAIRKKSAVPDVNVADGIVPLGEFKAQAARYLRELSDHDEPIVITQNGKPVAVVLSPEAFEDIRARQDYLEQVARGIEEADRGDLVEHRKVKDWLSSWGKPGERPPPRK